MHASLSESEQCGAELDVAASQAQRLEPWQLNRVEGARPDVHDSQLERYERLGKRRERAADIRWWSDYMMTTKAHQEILHPRACCEEMSQHVPTAHATTTPQAAEM